jgi:hypothetical protein
LLDAETGNVMIDLIELADCFVVKEFSVKQRKSFLARF